MKGILNAGNWKIIGFDNAGKLPEECDLIREAKYLICKFALPTAIQNASGSGISCSGDHVSPVFTQWSTLFFVSPIGLSMRL